MIGIVTGQDSGKGMAMNNGACATLLDDGSEDLAALRRAELVVRSVFGDCSGGWIDDEEILREYALFVDSGGGEEEPIWGFEGTDAAARARHPSALVKGSKELAQQLTGV